LSAIPLIVIVSVLTCFAHALGWLRSLESTALDNLLWLHPLTSKYVYIVGITSSDYESLFNERSPLNPEEVLRLINAIADGRPALIAVDLDTTDPRFKSLESIDLPCKIIWAQPSRSSEDAGQAGRPGGSLLMAGRVLGSDRPPAGRLHGLAAMPSDPDGIVRHYCRRILVQYKGVSSPEPEDSFIWSIVKAFRGKSPGSDGDINEQFVLRVCSDPKYLRRLSASDVLAVQGGGGWREMVEGKIVLLGGYYDAARDVYTTPAGRRQGVELVAQAVESELQYGGSRPVNVIVLLVCQLAVSIIFVLANYRFANTWIPLAMLVAAPVLGLVASAVLFSSLALWIDFAFVLFAVQLLFMYGHMRRVRKQNLALLLANEALIKARRELARAVSRGAEDERKRLAEEIHHDTLGKLFRVTTYINPLVKAKSDDDAAAKALAVVSEASGGIRRIMNNLYPAVLDNLGISDAVRELVDEARDAGIDITFKDETAGELKKLDKDSQRAIYRIAEQGLTNILQHAGANAAEVCFKTDDCELVLSISDNGQGMDPKVMAPTSYGVSGMKNLAELIDGNIEWKSPTAKFGKGTEVRLEVPLNQAGASDEATEG